MSTPIWLPRAHGIVPSFVDFDGPVQEEERFAALQRQLEDAHGEYRLRRLDEAARLLDEILPALKRLTAPRYRLLRASALSLRGCIHWRQAERAKELQNNESLGLEQARQAEAFSEAVKIFADHETAIEDAPSPSRLYTDYGIALYRTSDMAAAIQFLERARATGALPADGFAYLGLTYSTLGKYREAIDALKKGLQLAPGDKVLLDEFAKTLEEAAKKAEWAAESSDWMRQALRARCLAAVAHGKEDDLGSAEKQLRAALSIKYDDPQALSMLSLLLRSQDRNKEAADMLDDTLRRSPGHAWARGLRGILLRDEGKIEEAVGEFERVEVGNSKDLAWVWLEQAKTITKKDPRAAQALVDRAKRLLGNDDPQARQAQALVSFQQALAGAAVFGQSLMQTIRSVASTAGDPSALPETLGQFVGWLQTFGAATETRKKIGALNEAIQLRPEDIEARAELIRLHMNQKNYKGAEGVASEGLKIAPDSAPLLLSMAAILERQGKKGEAIDYYRLAARRAPDDETVFVAMVDALKRAGQTDEALRAVERALARDQRNVVALIAKGNLLVENGKLPDKAAESEAAAESLRRAETLLGPTDKRLLGVRVWLSAALRQLDRYDEAREVLEQAAKADNETNDVRAHLVTLLIEIAEYEAAGKLAQEAIDRLEAAGRAAPSPGTADAATAKDDVEQRLSWLYYARGWALYCACNAPASETEAAYKRAVQLAPTDPWAKKNLGGVLLRSEAGKEQGRKLILELVSAATQNELPVSLVGWCHFLLGNYAAAEHWIRGALASNPNDIGLQFDLGLVLVAAGQEGGAVAQYKAALEAALRRKKPRRRGLLHVALLDVIVCTKEGRIPAPSGQSVFDELHHALEKAGSPSEMLERLRYPIAAAAGG
jgi:tetratricopeptide (TPR) repeat protein